MRRAINVIVPLGVLGLLIWWADASAVMNQLRGASVGWLACAVVALTVVTLLMAKRWQIVARAVDIDINLPHAIAEYYIAQLVNLLLPGGIVGDVSRAVRARHGADLSRATQSVFAERLIGQGMMFILLCIGLFTAFFIPGSIAWPAAEWVAVIAGLMVLVVIVVCVVLLSRRTASTTQFLHLTLRLFAQPRVALLSLITALLLIFSLYACARATGTNVPGWLANAVAADLVSHADPAIGWRLGLARRCCRCTISAYRKPTKRWNCHRDSVRRYCNDHGASRAIFRVALKRCT